MSRPEFVQMLLCPFVARWRASGAPEPDGVLRGLSRERESAGDAQSLRYALHEAMKLALDRASWR